MILSFLLYKYNKDTHSIQMEYTLTQKIDCPDLPRGWPRTESQINTSPTQRVLNIKHTSQPVGKTSQCLSVHKWLLHGHTSQPVDKRPQCLSVFTKWSSLVDTPHNQLANAQMILCVTKCPQHQYKLNTSCQKRVIGAHLQTYCLGAWKNLSVLSRKTSAGTMLSRRETGRTLTAGFSQLAECSPKSPSWGQLGRPRAEKPAASLFPASS